MFTTGQVVDGAVNYTNANAVGGETVTGDNPTLSQNQTNLSLPASMACAQPIGSTWIANVTNWLCYAIDGAGLTYLAGKLIDDPMLLLKAIIALITTNSTNFYSQAALPSTANGRPCFFFNNGTNIIQIGSGTTIDLIPPGATAFFNGSIWQLLTPGPLSVSLSNLPNGSSVAVSASSTVTILLTDIHNEPFVTYDGTKMVVNATGKYFLEMSCGFTYSPTGSGSNVICQVTDNTVLMASGVHYLDTVATSQNWQGEINFSRIVNLTVGDILRPQVIAYGSPVTVNYMGFILNRMT